MRHIFAITAVVLALSFGLTSAQTNSVVSAEIEEQAKEIGHALRCVVCQNQSIEESDASLAEDMRRLVRVRLAGGDSPDEVIAFMQDRYGDYVLLKPPVQGNTYVLWFAPFALVLGVLFWLIRQGRVRAHVEETPLTEAEIMALEALSAKKEGAS